MASRLSSTLTLLSGLAVIGLASPASAAPIVDRINGALDPQACGGSGCWTNHLRVTDLDGDGNLDILLANYSDFFSGANDPEPLVIYQNDGAGGFTDVSGPALGDFIGNIRMAAVGDVDGDGDLDIYAPDGTGSAHALFINDGSGNFIDEADARLPTDDYPRSAASRMADVDGDGDLDIFAADGYASNGTPPGRLYINDGSGSFSEAVGAIPEDIEGFDIDDVEFFDADRDFDLDLVVNAHAGGIGALWLNDGSGNFAAETNIDGPGPQSNYHYNVTPCDVDGDGDLDLWFDNTGGGYTEQLQINDGSGNFTDETNQRVSGNPGADDNGVMCADVDDDGDLDAIVISLQGPERLLENDGSGNFTLVPDSFPAPGDCSLWGEFGDLDGDAKLDLVMGQGECTSSDEVYIGNDLMPVDSQAPRVIATQLPESVDYNDGSGIGVAHVAVSDSSVTDEGPRLADVWIELDGETETSGWFIGGDLFRVEFNVPGSDSTSARLCAEDFAGNVGCSDAVEITIVDRGGPPGDGDGDPTTGDGDGDPATGDGDGDATSSGEGETGNTGETGADDSPIDGDTGCSCAQDPERDPLGGILAGFGLLALAGLRRRRS